MWLQLDQMKDGESDEISWDLKNYNHLPFLPPKTITLLLREANSASLRKLAMTSKKNRIEFRFNLKKKFWLVPIATVGDESDRLTPDGLITGG
jgi:hypothetical protein